MEQFRLFPPRGMIKKPLPHDALREALALLAELLAAMVESSPPTQPGQGGHAHE